MENKRFIKLFFSWSVLFLWQALGSHSFQAGRHPVFFSKSSAVDETVNPKNCDSGTVSPIMSFLPSNVNRRTRTGWQQQQKKRKKNLPLAAYQDDNRDRESSDPFFFALSDQEQRNLETTINSFLRASHFSFKNVENMTNDLLNNYPLVALGIFVGAGVLVAYISGFFFLGGYIENWNPAENDSIPYWDEEILIITRKVGR